MGEHGDRESGDGAPSPGASEGGAKIKTGSCACGLDGETVFRVEAGRLTPRSPLSPRTPRPLIASTIRAASRLTPWIIVGRQRVLKVLADEVQTGLALDEAALVTGLAASGRRSASRSRTTRGQNRCTRSRFARRACVRPRESGGRLSRRPFAAHPFNALLNEIDAALPNARAARREHLLARLAPHRRVHREDAVITPREDKRHDQQLRPAFANRKRHLTRVSTRDPRLMPAASGFPSRFSAPEFPAPRAAPRQASAARGSCTRSK